MHSLFSYILTNANQKIFSPVDTIRSCMFLQTTDMLSSSDLLKDGGDEMAAIFVATKLRKM